MTVCPATIYQFIYADPELHQRLKPHLRHKKGYKVRTGQPEKRGQIKNRVSIDDRPEVVDLKERLGDWEAIIELMIPYRSTLQTITFDNGKEFAFHEQISKALTVEAYFAHPYHSCEHGLNENHNCLIRQYLPKGMPLDKATQEEANDITRRMNQRLCNKLLLTPRYLGENAA